MSVICQSRCEQLLRTDKWNVTNMKEHLNPSRVVHQRGREPLGPWVQNTPRTPRRWWLVDERYYARRWVLMRTRCKLRPSNDQQRRGAPDRHIRPRIAMRVHGLEGANACAKIRPASPKRSASTISICALYKYAHAAYKNTHSGYRRGIMDRKRQRRRNVAAAARKASRVDSAHIHAVVFVLFLQALVRPILLLGVA